MTGTDRDEPRPLRRYRALFISDIHLGTKGCQSRLLLDFLREVDADTIYLVGDIVDGWRLKQVWHWPQEHNDVVQKLLRKVRKGVRLFYIPGNHDEFLRDYYGTHFGGIEVVASAVHRGQDGKRYLIVHGDAFDVVVRYARWLALLGDWAYEVALRVNARVNWVRRNLGLTYWSLSQWAKLKVKNAVSLIGDFENALVAEAKRREVDGIICGHIHHAAMHDRLGIRYINCGDWVESCTAVAERYGGGFEIIRWAEEKRGEAAAAPEPKPTKPARPDPIAA
jgi:UDP-2,3-diacylglucosamine pyrophosphatase LpxH